MFFLVIISLLAFAWYFLWVKPYKYWEARGIPCVKPYPLFGNLGGNLFQSKHFSELLQDFYYKFPEQRFIGFYQFLSPVLVVRDPELIKEITVKDFDTFPEHRSFVPDDVDPLWSKNLFAIRGSEKWHDMRSTLSPSFTSSKMRMMYGLMKDCAKQFVEHFEKKKGLVEVEMKDSFTRYTNDVIASTAFGVTCNSLENQVNEFYLMGKSATDFTGLRIWKFVLYAICPGLTKLLKIGFFSGPVSNFFRGIISETIRAREQNNIVRPDMINLLMEARKGSLKHDSSEAKDEGFAVAHELGIVKQQKRQKIEISDEDITAQALIFFFAGFDTASTFMCFTVYELAINPNVQERLYREIKDVVDSGKGEISYETLLGMKYLDMVVTESLRKWPPAVLLDRVNIRPYTIDPKCPGIKPVTLEAGNTVWIPVSAIHRDPKYYPNPEKFEPERFSDENKDKIVPYTYLPFGAGPRNCIGSRFALLEGKLILFEILKKFEIVPVEKTQIPLKLLPSGLTPTAEKGFWLRLKPRE